MKFISFFAGIGGIDLGLERAGHECIGQVEIDAYCLKVLEKHWPNVQRWKDIRELTGKELPKADFWTAGFPCQDISVAGKKTGITGTRTGLFFELMRLICVVRPKYILLENVPGLLHRGMGEVLGELAESGYDAEWNCISAASVGAPHLRERIFIVASPPSTQLNGISQRNKERQITSCCFPPDNSHTKLADSSIKRLERPEPARRIFRRKERLSAKCDTKWWEVEPDVGRMANGIPFRVDRLKCLGNAVVPQVAEWIGRQLKEME